MKTVRACGCSYEKTLRGVDQLVCKEHARRMFEQYRAKLFIRPAPRFATETRAKVDIKVDIEKARKR